ncbi:MAG: FecR family protein [Deltaproteobacteria bacterium]|nr:FecR family protein [Deltaproteobacteria bacterium]
MKRMLPIAAILVLFAVPALAFEPVGAVTAVHGEAYVKRAGEGRIPLAVGVTVFVGDAVVTGLDGRVMILFEDNCRLSVGSDTQVLIDEYVLGTPGGTRSGLFNLLWGKIRVLVGELMNVSTNTRVMTPNAVAGVSGTYFIVTHDPQIRESLFLTLSGEISVWTHRATRKRVPRGGRRLSPFAGRPRARKAQTSRPGHDPLPSQRNLRPGRRAENELPGHLNQLGDDPLRGWPTETYGALGEPGRAAEGEAGTEFEAYEPIEPEFSELDVLSPSDRTPDGVRLRDQGDVFAEPTLVIDSTTRSEKIKPTE